MVNGLYPGHAAPNRTRQHINGWNDLPKEVSARITAAWTASFGPQATRERKRTRPGGVRLSNGIAVTYNEITRRLNPAAHAMLKAP